jgi:hypothetical protein
VMWNDSMNNERSAIIAFLPTYAQTFCLISAISITSFHPFLLVFLIYCIWAAACFVGGAGHFSPFITILIPQPNWVHVPKHICTRLTDQAVTLSPFIRWTLTAGVHRLYSLHVLRPLSNRPFTTLPRHTPSTNLPDSTLISW